MGYRLINIDKVLLINFKKVVNGSIIPFKNKNDIITFKFKFFNKTFELVPKYYIDNKGLFPDLSSLTMDNAFNFSTGMLPENYNREILNNIIKIYNDKLAGSI